MEIFSEKLVNAPAPVTSPERPLVGKLHLAHNYSGSGELIYICHNVQRVKPFLDRFKLLTSADFDIFPCFAQIGFDTGPFFSRS